MSMGDASIMLMSLRDTKIACMVIAITIVVDYVVWNLTATSVVIMGKARRLVVSCEV
jgi:hypothetical protein